MTQLKRGRHDRRHEVRAVQRECEGQDLGPLDVNTFIFAYVDIFSLYRPDFRADLEAGEIGGFTVNQSFLLGTTGYVLIPSLMVFCAVILPPRVNRIANIALSIVYAPTIIVAAIGEWNYYIVGSAMELALLAAIVFYAWTWPKVTPQLPERTATIPTA